ncbi:TetR family transcriptional regulator [Mycolicibacterium fluoranthenivorans]|uniref:AcrR family transcriptional regulator n=1 Tax=Mycolicibacterium fluoranthenivorans TaxID=258505 RepID=A0A7X5ZGB7_9MYCO|nr:TetR family transcriptional regulator [Mycolicibacterium fluoranthenivorans]MCV7356510.1 TetR family transcriptional regulator [Mycolicibacterium fluoranthenivorans]NIH99103.1 AcrR family transcriptional regulator [Mycolicibacterium fluoranthenivorans]
MITPGGAGESLQRRMKDRMLSEVAEMATQLFLAKGFDETTVDEICAAAGLSRRSFFRYFKTKEDVVISQLPVLSDIGCEVFLSRPPDEDVWTALRHSLTPFVEWVDEDHARALAFLALIEKSPTLRFRYLDRVDRWQAGLVAAARTRLAHSGNDLYLPVIVAAATGAYRAAGKIWAQSGGGDSISALFDEAFAALAPAPYPDRGR